MNNPCPLCLSQETCPLVAAANFFRCAQCGLISRDPKELLEPAEELERYSLHDNSDTPEYRLHLARLLIPLKEKLKPGAEGLDYGCGPIPLLGKMMQEQGHPTASYDPYFFPETNLLNKDYDFLLCCEVVEHFYSPAQEFPKLVNLLKTNGVLAIMTQSPPEDLNEFPNWYYQRDPTHVVFYSAKTFRWIEKQWNLKWESYGKGVSVLSRN